MGLYEDMRVFIKVCELENFSKAAEHLNMSSSSVSKAIKRFEDITGERLLNRNTHKIALTNVGKTLFDRSKFIVNEMNQINKLVKTKEIDKALKITFCNDCKYLFQEDFLSVVKDEKYDRDIVVCDSTQDKEKFDFVSSRSDFYLFVGVPKESNLIARKLGSCSFSIYIPKDSDIKTLKEVVGHTTYYSTRNRKLSLRFKSETELKGSFIFASYKDSLDYAVKERQAVLLPSFFQEEALASGLKKTETIIEESQGDVGIYLCYMMKKYQKNDDHKSFTDSLITKLKNRIKVSSGELPD